MAKPKTQWMPTHYSIKALAPSVTKAFVMAILPKVVPTAIDIEEALRILGMTEEPVCVYCGDKQSQWDHLRPVVTDSMPTGYISEIQNIVPSCGPCNGSKGAKDWRQWITSDAAKSPSSRRVRDIDLRIQRLEAYERWRRPTVVDFAELLGLEEWRRYWDDWAKVKAALADAQPRADGFKTVVQGVVTPAHAMPVSAAPLPAPSGFWVRSPTAVTAPLPKRRAILAAVIEAAKLIPCSEIRQVIGVSAFRSVPGLLGGDELWHAFAATHGLHEKHRKEWFGEAPILEVGSTWLLRANVWGPQTEAVFAALSEATGGQVTVAAV